MWGGGGGGGRTKNQMDIFFLLAPCAYKPPVTLWFNIWT